MVRFTGRFPLLPPRDKFMDLFEKDIRLFQEAIRNYSSYDFNGYTIKSLKRRLTRILRDYSFGIEEMIKAMQSDSIFLEEVVKKLSVSTTELFRDPEVWKHLRKEVLPRFSDKDVINIWHPGCSTGQEVYTLMILLDDLEMLEKANIYASDINNDLLNIAKEGKYPFRFNKSYLENFDKAMNFTYNNIKKVRNISWTKYFSVDMAMDMIQMKDCLRDKPVYKKMDLVKDPNLFFVNFDLIVCRNVIIYFNYELQNKVFDLFYKSLNRNGCLLLGLHESVMGPFSNHFTKNSLFYFKN